MGFLFRRHSLLIAGILLLGLHLSAECPASIAEKGLSKPIPRTIAIIFDSSSEKTSTQTLAHTFLEAPLSALGLKTFYVDVNRPEQLNDTKSPAVFAIASAFPAGTRLADPKAYIDFLVTTVESGKKLLLFNDPGFLFDANEKPVPLEQQNRVFNLFAAQSNGSFVTTGIGVLPRVKDQSFFTDATPWHPSFENIPRLKLTTSTTHIIADEQIKPSDIIHPDITSESIIPAILQSDRVGILSLGSTAFSYTSAADQTPAVQSWHVNPFALLKMVLPISSQPQLDLTSAFGSRALITLFSGGGLTQRTTIEKYAASKSISADVFDKEIVAVYPSILFTLAPVAAELDSNWGASSDAIDIAHRLFQRPNIAPAVSGYSNMWDLDSLDPDHRQFKNKPFTLETEILDAIKFQQKLSPSDVDSFCFILGDTQNPNANILQLLQQNKVCAIQFKDSRSDPLHPSLGWMRASGLQNLEIKASNSKAEVIALPFASENIFNNSKSALQDGYQAVLTTIKNTEEPKRISPISLEFGLDIGTSAARLATARTILSQVSQNTFPLSLSDFVANARGFAAAELFDCGLGCFEIKHRGALNSVRFQKSAASSIAIENSVGILGTNNVGDDIFVMLDPAVETPKIIFSPTEIQPDIMTLESSSWIVKNLHQDEKSLHFQTEQRGIPGTIIWNLPATYSPKDLRIIQKNPEHAETIQPEVPTSIRDNQIRITLPAGDPKTIDISFSWSRE